MYSILTLLIFSLLFYVGLSIFEENSNLKLKFDNDGDTGEPLFLTPYIEDGNIEEARNLARVLIPEVENFTSYSGFFTVDKKSNSNLFAWFFPAERRIEPDSNDTTLILWLQGGLGHTTLIGLFDEIGSIYVVDKRNISRRERLKYWSDFYHVLFIDSPVGSGFSFTDDPKGYATDQNQISEQLYEALTQFYKLFPEMSHQDFIIHGEGYGGKYAANLAYRIHQKNRKANVTGDPVMPFKGIAIASGWCDPINQIDYGEYLFQMGLIDMKSEETIKRKTEETKQLIEKESWIEAYESGEQLMSNLTDIVGKINFYNQADLLIKSSSMWNCTFCDVINTDDMRKAIHVGNLTLDYINEDVHANLKGDFMRSVAPLLSDLLESYKILFYNGQLDLVTPFSMTMNYLHKLNWSGREKYENALRALEVDIFNMTGRILFLSYGQRSGNIQDYMLRGAGHYIAIDQPFWTLSCIWTWLDYVEISTVSEYGDELYGVMQHFKTFELN